MGYTRGGVFTVNSSTIEDYSIENTDVSNSAAIAYSKLNLANSIINADINTSAAITRTKLATTTANTIATNDSGGNLVATAVTASRAVATDANGLPTASATTATELGYVNGVTSAIQTQINTKVTSPTWATFTPTVTLVGGSGNVVPVYITNVGRYTTIGKTVFVEIYLTGDGGAEGAGSGQLTIALPVAVGTNHQENGIFAGYGIIAGGLDAILFVDLPAGATTVPVYYFATIGAIGVVSGNSQNTVARTIRLKFYYEIN